MLRQILLKYVFYLLDKENATKEISDAVTSSVTGFFNGARKNIMGLLTGPTTLIPAGPTGPAEPAPIPPMSAPIPPIPWGPV